MPKRKEPANSWPVPQVLTDLIAETERRGIEPARVGRFIGSRRSTNPGAERQSLYDARSGKKRVWLHDAATWAEELHGRLQLRFDDPWSNALAAVRSIPGLPPTRRDDLIRLIEGDRAERTEARAPARDKRQAASS